MNREHHEGLILEAAELTAAMLRFQEPLAYLRDEIACAPGPVIGQDAYCFLPDQKMVSREDVPAYLATLPGPAFIAPTLVRGIVALVCIAALGASQRASMEHQFANQIASLAQGAPGPASDRVLLEFGGESRVFSLAAVRVWAERFGVFVGWNIGRCEEPGRAEWRMKLLGADGRSSAEI